MGIVTRLGNFCKIILTSILTKATQVFGNVVDHFENQYILSKNNNGYLLGNIRINWVSLLFQHLVTLVTGLIPSAFRLNLVPKNVPPKKADWSSG